MTIIIEKNLVVSLLKIYGDNKIYMTSIKDFIAILQSNHFI